MPYFLVASVNSPSSSLRDFRVMPYCQVGAFGAAAGAAAGCPKTCDRFWATIVPSRNAIRAATNSLVRVDMSFLSLVRSQGSGVRSQESVGRGSGVRAQLPGFLIPDS